MDVGVEIIDCPWIRHRMIALDENISVEDISGRQAIYLQTHPTGK